MQEEKPPAINKLRNNDGGGSRSIGAETLLYSPELKFYSNRIKLSGGNVYA
jgi:hypothetical protein